MTTLTELPKYFAIKCNINNPLWQKYIHWLNKKYNDNMFGIASSCYYGNSSKNEIINSGSLHDFPIGTVELTLEQWDSIVNKQNTITKYKGEIADFPEEIVEKMLERQVEQGNPRDVSVFKKIKRSDVKQGGFNWYKTIEGNSFWNNVIDNKNFDLFFEKYPKEAFLEKWAIKLSNKEEIKLFRSWLPESVYAYYYGGGLLNYFHFPNFKDFKGFKIKYHTSDICKKGYQEITIDQFKKYILKMENKEARKIIGYKTPCDLFGGSVKKDEVYVIGLIRNQVIAKFYVPKKLQDSDSFTSDQMIPKEIVETWEPVYEEEFKIGEWVTITEVLGDGWLNYTVQKTFQLENIPSQFRGGKFCKVNGGKGLHAKFRKATPEEIAEAQKPQLSIINNYRGKIEGDYIIYGSNCAKFHKNFFIDLLATYKDQNRTIKSIKLNTDVEITIEQIKQIVDVINSESNN